MPGRLPSEGPAPRKITRHVGVEIMARLLCLGGLAVVARASSCQAGTFDNGGTCTSCPSVGDVTVCPEESSDLRNLTLLGFFPMSGGWTGGIQALPATELAIARLNADPSILPRHRVQLAWNDTQCSVAKGVELTQDLLHAHPTAAAIVGGGCSGVCEPIAWASSALHIPQVSYGCVDPKYSDDSLYPYFMRASLADSQMRGPWVELCLQNGWTQVVTIAGDNTLFSGTMDAFEAEAAKYNITVAMQIRLSSTTASDAIAAMAAGGAACAVGVFIAMYEADGASFVGAAYDAGLMDGRAWVGVGWWSETWWSTYGLSADAVEGFLGTSTYVKSNLALYEDFSLAFETSTGVAPADQIYHVFLAHDVVFTLGRALHAVVEAAGDDDAAGAIDGPTLMAALLAQNFSGVSGDVAFDAVGDRLGTFEWFNWHDGARSSVGTWSAATGNVFTDTVWFPGATATAPVEPDCVECAAGEYYDASATACTACAAGTFALGAGVRSSCTDCAAGKYAKFEGMDHCVTCPEDAYQPLEGADTCSACPDGSQRVAQIETASGDLIAVLGVSLAQCECMEGYYVLDGSSGVECSKCPDGATCGGNRSLPYPGKGYWTNTRSAAFLGDHYECPIPELCEGLWHLRSCFTSPRAFDSCDAASINWQQDATFRRLSDGEEGEANGRRLTESSHQLFKKQMCSEGNLGTFCGVCQAGFYKGSGSQGCVGCEGQIETTLIAFFALVFVIGGGAFWLRWRIKHAIAGTMPPLAPYLYALFLRAYHALYDTGRFKVVWSTYQIISMINDNLDMEWPGAFGGFERLLGFSQLSLTTGIMPVACFDGDFNYYDNLTLTLAWPLVALMVNWLVMAPKGGVTSGVQYERFETIKLMLLYVVLPTASLAIFKLFVCTEELADGTSYLKADLSIQCYTDQYKGYATLAAVGILVYPIGIPCYFLYSLGVFGFDGCCVKFGKDRYHTLRAGKADADPKLRSRRLLYEAYIPERAPWYEFADSIRRIFLTALIVFMGETSAQRAAAGCMISLISLAFVREASPYVTPSNNPLSVVASYSILFTYVMAFLITAQPFAIDPIKIGAILVPANILLAIMAMVWQWHEAKRQIELERQKQALRKAAEDLAKANVKLEGQLKDFDNAAIGLVVGVKTLSIGMRRVTMRYLWGDKALIDMNSTEIDNAARTSNLETRNARSEEEKKRLLRQAQKAHERGEKLAEWCWQEDDHKIAGHDKKTVRPPNWILYSDLVAAQLEEKWQADKAAIFEIDVNGQTRSATGGKAYAAETGTLFTIDLTNMTQKNKKSGFARKIRREAISADAGDIELGEIGSSSITDYLFKPKPTGPSIQIDAVPASDPGTGLPKALGDDDMPEFPDDLMNPGLDVEGNQKEPEPILLIKEGMIVQVQAKRDDGWWYGFALDNAENADNASTAQEIPLKDMVEALKQHLKSSPDAGLRNLSSTAIIVDAACKKFQADAKGTIKERAKAAYDAMRDKEGEDTNDVGTGWFPSSFVGPVTAKQLNRLQARLSRPVGGAEPTNAVNDVLAPPSTWQELPEGARGAVHFIPVDPKSAEFAQVLNAFVADLRGKADILGIERIQNRGLWQSYAVKCQTIRSREDDRRRDNLSAIAEAEIERKWFFHGSDADTLMNKISSQGFNRSFAGKNAVMYGRGVYFARGSYYSARDTYSKPDNRGVQRMLMCRVAVGAYCKGENGRLVPDERESGSGVLFDSTVENLADPFIFVTYHDAQAYPEYIVKFNNYRFSG